MEESYVPGSAQEGRSTRIAYKKKRNISGIEDHEVNRYLNNTKQAYYKRIIWEMMNREYLENHAKKSLTSVSGTTYKAPIKDSLHYGCERSRKKRTQADFTSSPTAGVEETRKMLDKERLGSKFNLDALEKLSDDLGTHDIKKSRTESSHPENLLDTEAAEDGGSEEDEFSTELGECNGNEYEYPFYRNVHGDGEYGYDEEDYGSDY